MPADELYSPAQSPGFILSLSILTLRDPRIHTEWRPSLSRL